MKLLYSIFLTCLFLCLANGLGLNSDPDMEGSKRHKDKGPSSYLNSCGNSSDILTIKSYQFEPNLLIKGENLHFEVNGSLSKVIEAGAYVDLKVKYGIFTVAKKTIDLCDKITAINKKCPLKKGDFRINEVVQVPTSVPRGKYKLEIEAFTSNEQRVTCINGVIRIASPDKDND